ncbi:hypothetical protein DFH09DRAFT_1169832 [Mycena vulgaris]|nr:hypothetical protein DFH09DRAFT_1169832 [Mycena vulgaris]
MPHSPSTLVQYTLVAANALQAVSAATQIPFLKSICSLSISLIPLIENAKFQKDRCLRMLEDLHCVLCAIMALSLQSINIGSPQILHQIAQYAETLQKFHTYLRAYSELGKIKRLFKQSEITAQLDVCERELKAASVIFTTQYGMDVACALLEMDLDTERRHQELLELISSRSESFSTVSSMQGSLFSNSSGSFSLLPASPKIFHGRDYELNDLIGTLLQDAARVAVLGPGGMGKTTLAMTALHCTAVTEKYTIRHFISCESANTGSDLVSIVGSHLGLEPSRQLSKAIVRHFGESGPCLLVLDNVETPWEPLESRPGVEEFLSLLTDISTLTLLITMRGAERPAKVKWTRPFLPPLEPLEPSASRQIFADVAGEPEIGEELVLDELLILSGSLPLAVSLMATIASFEGYTSTLSRWKMENTALLSDGHDKRSNLEISIDLSLESPRLSASPHARELLSLLSILPDGITDEDINISKVPLPDIAHCRSSLVRTSMAYIDVHGRLKTLSPIREYMRRVYPPSVSLSRPLRIYFQDLLAIWNTYNDLHSGNLVPKLVSCLGNINDLVLNGLAEDENAQLDIAHSIILLNVFSQKMLKGSSLLIQKLPGLIEANGDSHLRWSYACAYLKDQIAVDPDDAEHSIDEGIQHFSTVQCNIEEVIAFYLAAAYYYYNRDFLKAKEFINLASQIEQKTNNSVLRTTVLRFKCSLVRSLRDAEAIIKAVHEARKSAGFIPDRLDIDLMQYEAAAYNLLGNLSYALEVCSKAINWLVASGLEDSDNLLAFLDIQADIHWRKTEYAQAHKLQTLIASKTSLNRSPGFHANALVVLAYLDTISGGDEVAILRNLGGAKMVYQALGAKRIMLCDLVTAELYLREGNTINARVTFEKCLSRSQGIYPDIAGVCIAAFGDRRNKMHNKNDTLHWAMVHFARVHKAKDRVDIFHALRCLADIYNELYDEDTALTLYYTVLEGAIEMNIHRLRAESMIAIGDIMLRRGESKQAKEMWEAARPLFIKSSRMKDAAATDARLVRLSESDTRLVADIADTIGKLDKLAIISTPESTPLVDAGNPLTALAKNPLEGKAPVFV